jgi:hypothetical protein
MYFCISDPCGGALQHASDELQYFAGGSERLQLL